MATPIISSVNPLKENITYIRTKKSSEFYTSKLLNYVESVEIEGVLKTVFYSETSTNFNIGDRVFIVNGNYDTNDRILVDKYTKRVDGYKVLGCEGCRIILDLDYTGQQPYIESGFENSIKVYHIRSQREFDYINSVKFVSLPITVRDSSGTYLGGLPSTNYISKFSGEVYNLTTGSPTQSAVLFSDSIIYAQSAFDPSFDFLNDNSGVLSSGFYIRNLNNTWINITNNLLSGDILGKNNFYSLTKKLYIFGEDIPVTNPLNELLKQRNVYKFSDNAWSIDTTYKKPFISKLNFRNGTFKGTHNDGVFGTNLKRTSWSEGNWNSGALVNSVWNKGQLNSKSRAGVEFYSSELRNGTTQSTPIQTVDTTNNRGFGYTFISDTTFVSGTVSNGNFENCNFGTSSLFSAVDIYFGLAESFGMQAQGRFELCDINSTIVENSTLVNCQIVNSQVSNSKIVNSQTVNSTANKSIVSDESGIKILVSDVWSYVGQTNQSPDVRGILKLYISDKDFERLNLGDAFYLTNVNKSYILSSLSEDHKVVLPLETKYLLDNFFNGDFSGEKIVVSLKGKRDNRYRSNARTVGATLVNSYTVNKVNYNSIDIDTKEFAFYRLGNGSYILPTTNSLTPFIESQATGYIRLLSKVFDNTYIKNSDFKSGYIDNSNWQSQDNINYSYNKIEQILFNSPNEVRISLLKQRRYNREIDIIGEDILENDNVWLKSLSVNGKQIDGRYRVNSVVKGTGPSIYDFLYLENLDGLTFSNGIIQTNGAEYNNYNSVHKLLINNTQIKKGLLRRSGFNNSVVYISDFDNRDKNITQDNISKSRLVNIIFQNGKNQVKSGLVFNSHFVDETWVDGLLYKCIWNGGSFQNGISKSAYWQSGTFVNGSFIDSYSTQAETVDFDQLSVYQNWFNGQFNLGEFFNSVWINGTFSNGRFYKSNWYSGNWINGVLGAKSVPTIETKFGYESPLLFSGTTSYWFNGIVDNATIGGNGLVYWYLGKFESGEFTSFGQSSSNQSIWYDGDFLGGKFNGLARWKGGNFKGGKFLSYYGQDMVNPINPSTFSTDYGWERGRFLGGEFGNASTGTNSVWYNGEFRGGIFSGRFWRKGIFYRGVLLGSGTMSISNSNQSNLQEYNFANSFTQSYFGLWYDGFVTDTPQNVQTEQRVTTELVRKKEEKKEDNTAVVQNALWINGTFSHKNATFFRSLWLNGTFEKGTFDSSIFNPYVDRDFTGSYSNSSFTTASSCVWMDGTFNSTSGTGSFYVSEWNKGTFNNGYISGAVWRTGTLNYGSADNILWLDGRWRNGNWNGSPFDYLQLATISNTQYGVVSGRAKDIINNVSSSISEYSILGSTLIHINNGFSASNISNILTDENIGGLNGVTSSWYSATGATYTGVVGISQTLTGRTITQYGDLLCSDWNYGTTYSKNSFTVSNNTHLYTSGGEQEVSYGRFTPQDGYNSTNTDYPNPPISNKLYASLNNNNLEVFNVANASYEIKLTLSVEFAQYVYGEFGIGENSPVTITFSSIQEYTNTGLLNYWPKIYNVNFVYNTPQTLTTESQQMWIRKLSGGILRLLSATITRRSVEYHPIYNNILWPSIQANGSIELPSDERFATTGISDNGNIVSINFGNGAFVSGIWENGVWNNGYRSRYLIGKNDYVRFSGVIGLNGLNPYNSNNTVQISETNWYITLQGVDSVSEFSVGDNVSIGNLVAIDVNEQRRLIKDYFKVVLVNIPDNVITVQYITNFPVRRIEKDSSIHLIYVTKNIWLSGAFLNGFFSGVWNNGLFKGYPKISIIADTHFIDGKFDGGRFVSKRLVDPILNGSYNTSVIQKFTFNDNNVSGIVNAGTNTWKKYLSWMDLNYLSNSYTTNLRQNNDTFTVVNPSFLGITYSYFRNEENLKGDITYDVLQSFSNFRNSYSLETSNYYLGTKYKTFENLVPNDGKFESSFTNVPYDGIPPQQVRGGDRLRIGLDNFIDNGWTYSNFGMMIGGGWSQSGDAQFTSNIDLETSNKFKLSFTQSAVITGTGSYQGFAKFILNNLDIQTTPSRYYLTELDMASFSFTPFTTSQVGWIKLLEGYKLSLGTDVDERTSDGLVKRQYFYNTQNLDLEIDSLIYAAHPAGLQPQFEEMQWNLLINSLSLYEVDMIPFFKYAQTSEIDTRIKVPYSAVAPVINYNDAKFDFVGNVNLTFDTEGILSQNPITSNVNVVSPGQSTTLSGSVNIPTEDATQITE